MSIFQFKKPWCSGLLFAAASCPISYVLYCLQVWAFWEGHLSDAFFWPIAILNYILIWPVCLFRYFGPAYGTGHDLLDLFWPGFIGWGLFGVGLGYILRHRQDSCTKQSPNPALQPTPTRDYVAGGRG